MNNACIQQAIAVNRRNFRKSYNAALSDIRYYKARVSFINQFLKTGEIEQSVDLDLINYRQRLKQASKESVALDLVNYRLCLKQSKKDARLILGAYMTTLACLKLAETVAKKQTPGICIVDGEIVSC